MVPISDMMESASAYTLDLALTTTNSYDNQDLIGPAKKGPCEVYNLMVRVVFGGIVAVLGLGGNILTIIILGKDRKKSITIQCLIYLAVVDCFVLLLYGFTTVSITALHWFNENLLAQRYHDSKTDSLCTGHQPHIGWHYCYGHLAEVHQHVQTTSTPAAWFAKTSKYLNYMPGYICLMF